ncbi:MAG: ornithine aminomutase subunit alpha [Propionibacteriaceae bacterium]|nr:ornithine aminomutase subunit alpha [Propionibacteriaceae bacterium]
MNTDEQERMQRFETLRAELATMDDAALKARFWELCQQVMEPVVELSRTHTSPSIERSVLLRMGIDSVTTHAVVENVLNAGLLGKGAGHAVLRLAQRDGISIRDAGTAIAEDPTVLAGLFEERKQ